LLLTHAAHFCTLTLYTPFLIASMAKFQLWLRVNFLDSPYLRGLACRARKAYAKAELGRLQSPHDTPKHAP